jgi:hypothetical protein
MSSDASHFDAALAAMSADELRRFLREFSRQLGPAAREHLQGALMERAARGPSGWRPSPPPSDVATQVQQFLDAANKTGAANPERVDEFLRKGNQAFLAGDMPAARAILGPLLTAIAEGGFDLGQEETEEEVLMEPLRPCVARFLVAVYLTTPLAQRADSLLAALETVNPVGNLSEPLRDMEQVATAPLPELDAFLPLWISALRHKHVSGTREWESPGGRRLREAVTRAEGIAGLGRLARASKQPQALQAWCTALVERGQWREALHAFEEAASLVSSEFWRGSFLDGAALATRELGHGDFTQRLATAWRAVPSLQRLLRWLEAGDPSATTLKKRATLELAQPPTRSPLLLGVLHLVAGGFESAAHLLATAPGLGWSNAGHPGHVLFPAFAWLLGGAPEGSLCSELIAPLSCPPGALPGSAAGDSAPLEPASGDAALHTPALLTVLERDDLARRLTPATQQKLRDTLRQAAWARAMGVIHEKRRRHYGHAALLAACCVELDHAASPGDRADRWVTSLRAETKRYPAFQAALEAALKRARRTPPHRDID